MIALSLELGACHPWKRPEPVATVPAAAFADELSLLAAGPTVLGDDAVVRVVSNYTECTGTLISPRLVLTAHHCVAVRDEAGNYLPEDVDPESLTIELGSDYLPWGEALVRHIVAPGCGHGAGEGDIAVLVLASELPSIHPKTVALEARPAVGWRIDAVGFGRCDDSEDGIRLRERTEAAIESVDTSTFRAEAAICAGDSGGPAINPRGEVVGVLSASALDPHEATKNLTEFTRVDHWRELFDFAQRLASGQTPAELPPVSGCGNE